MSRESTVALQIDAEHTQVRLARLVAAALAAQEGYDLEAVEDLRISVDEACVWLIEEGDGSPLRLVFSVGADDELRVTGETGRGTAGAEGTLGPLAAQILAASCAEHACTVDGTSARFSLRARASAAAGGGPPGDRGTS